MNPDHPVTLDTRDWSDEDLVRVCAERGLPTDGKPAALRKRIADDVEAAHTAVVVEPAEKPVDVEPAEEPVVVADEPNAQG